MLPGVIGAGKGTGHLRMPRVGKNRHISTKRCRCSWNLDGEQVLDRKPEVRRVRQGGGAQVKARRADAAGPRHRRLLARQGGGAVGQLGGHGGHWRGARTPRSSEAELWH